MSAMSTLFAVTLPCSIKYYYLDFTKIFPLAAGVCALPTNSTSARIVTIYGIMEIRFGDTILLWLARLRIPLQKPNSRHAFISSLPVRICRK